VRVFVMRPRCCVTARPHRACFARHLPHKGEGRTGLAARANSISPEYSLMRQATPPRRCCDEKSVGKFIRYGCVRGPNVARDKKTRSLVKDISLVGEYEILPGDEDDGGLARVGRVGRGGAEVLIAFDAPTPMGDALFDRAHRPSAFSPIEI